MNLRDVLRGMVEKYDLDKQTEYNQRTDVIARKEREDAELNNKIRILFERLEVWFHGPCNSHANTIILGFRLGETEAKAARTQVSTPSYELDMAVSR